MLSIWAEKQRTLYMKRKKGKTPALSEERRAIVEELGLFKTDYLRLGDKDT